MNKYYRNTERQQAAARFQALMTYKESHLEDAREGSRLTKPSVIPPQGHTSGAQLPRPESSHGARMVNNLVSQLLLILFPPGIPYFRLDLEALDLKSFAKDQDLGDGRNMYDALRESFVGLETSCAQAFDTQGYRDKMNLVLQQLVVAGDSCYIETQPAKGTGISTGIEIIPQEDWVCTRSPSGSLIEVVIKRDLSISEAMSHGLDPIEESSGLMTIYSRHYQTKPNHWVNDEYIGNQEEPYSTYVTKGSTPEGVHVAYWNLTSGEDYGKSVVDENLGDIRTYESGIKIVKQSASALAKVVFATKPNGTIRPQVLAEAENCDIIEGSPSDVGVIQANKVYDMGSFIQLLNAIKSELDIVFMMPTALRRNAERVTAEEIREIASQFERTRGSTYGLLSQHLQAPMANILLRYTFSRMTEPVGSMKISDLVPIINTGLQGLGRTLELEGYLMLLNDLGRSLPQGLAMFNQRNLIHKLAGLRGIEIASVLKTSEEMQQEQEQAMAAQMMATQSNNGRDQRL